MKLFDTKADADDGLKVARNWKQMCFIGRDNDKDDRYRYIITLLARPRPACRSGSAPALDCVTYNPAQLTIYSGVAHPADPDQDEWALYAGPIPLLFLASEPDALRAKIVARGAHEALHHRPRQRPAGPGPLPDVPLAAVEPAFRIVRFRPYWCRVAGTSATLHLCNGHRGAMLRWSPRWRPAIRPAWMARTGATRTASSRLRAPLWVTLMPPPTSFRRLFSSRRSGCIRFAILTASELGSTRSPAMSPSD